MRRSRDELVTAKEKMAELRSQNKTVREIADIMGYKSAGTVTEHLRHGGYYSIVLSKLEITYLLDAIKRRPRTKVVESILAKLTKITRGKI